MVVYDVLIGSCSIPNISARTAHPRLLWGANRPHNGEPPPRRLIAAIKAGRTTYLEALVPKLRRKSRTADRRLADVVKTACRKAPASESDGPTVASPC